MKSRIAFRMLLVAPFMLVAIARADDKTSSANSARFEAIKNLAGDWVEVGKDGKPTDKLVSSFRVTAGGTAVQETLFPGSDHEMVTMYHLDEPDLVLTHYCVLGNQPRMKAGPSQDAKVIPFTFIGITNLKSEDDSHMNQGTLTLASADRFQAEWVACKDGKPCHTASFDLVRKPK